jgi:peptide subunit release factor 1 (eRF1)
MLIEADAEVPGKQRIGGQSSRSASSRSPFR